MSTEVDCMNLGPTVRIAIVGDYNAKFPTHVATDAGLAHASAALGVRLDAVWIGTPLLAADAAAALGGFDGLYVAPGSPYASMEGALNAVTFGRTRGVPLIATCGGYQHVVVEYARRVLGEVDAEHAEYNPGGSKLFITALPCSLVGQRLDILLEPGSCAAAFYSRGASSEEYYCNFGLNPDYRELLERGGLAVSGTDQSGEARILELPDHPFFIATLFVPPLTSRPESPHPLLIAYLRAARDYRHTRDRETSAMPGSRASERT